jgi:hypothetical protein
MRESRDTCSRGLAQGAAARAVPLREAAPHVTTAGHRDDSDDRAELERMREALAISEAKRKQVLVTLGKPQDSASDCARALRT